MLSYKSVVNKLFYLCNDNSTHNLSSTPCMARSYLLLLTYNTYNITFWKKKNNYILQSALCIFWNKVIPYHKFKRIIKEKQKIRSIKSSEINLSLQISYSIKVGMVWHMSCVHAEHSETAHNKTIYKIILII